MATSGGSGRAWDLTLAERSIGTLGKGVALFVRAVRDGS